MARIYPLLSKEISEIKRAAGVAALARWLLRNPSEWPKDEPDEQFIVDVLHAQEADLKVAKAAWSKSYYRKNRDSIVVRKRQLRQPLTEAEKAKRRAKKIKLSSSQRAARRAWMKRWMAKNRDLMCLYKRRWRRARGIGPKVIMTDEERRRRVKESRRRSLAKHRRVLSVHSRERENERRRKKYAEAKGGRVRAYRRG